MSWAVPIAGCVLLVLVFVGAFLDTLHREKQVDAVLGHLLMFGESYGREMVGFSRGVLARGTVYVLLGQLEQEGLVYSREEALTPDYVGIPRRLYSLTARGHAEAIRRASEITKAKAQ